VVVSVGSWDVKKTAEPIEMPFGVIGADAGRPMEPSSIWGRDPRREENFVGCLDRWKALGVSAVALYTAKKSMTATAGLRQPAVML